MQIEEIIEAINASRVVLSRYSIKEAAADNLIPEDINQSVIENGEIIEDYPQAYPMPACLILGFKTTGEPIPKRLGIR